MRPGLKRFLLWNEAGNKKDEAGGSKAPGKEGVVRKRPAAAAFKRPAAKESKLGGCYKSMYKATGCWSIKVGKKQMLQAGRVRASNLTWRCAHWKGCRQARSKRSRRLRLMDTFFLKTISRYTNGLELNKA